jgi:hypothetical protein
MLSRRQSLIKSAGLCAGGFMLALTFLALSADLRANPSDPLIPTWDYRPCSDKAVGRLVGLPKDTALARVAKMNLHSFRLLYPEQVVNFEVDKSRLTMVVDKHLRITRAFCR